MKLDKKYVLMESDPKFNWEILPKGSYHLPWGYELSECGDWWIPIPAQLELLDVAERLTKEYSYEEVARWLTARSGRYISGPGIFRRFKKNETTKRRLDTLRLKKAKLEDIIGKIEYLERTIHGQHSDRKNTSKVEASAD